MSAIYITKVLKNIPLPWKRSHQKGRDSVRFFSVLSNRVNKNHGNNCVKTLLRREEQPKKGIDSLHYDDHSP